jgi:hypothetical protein
MRIQRTRWSPFLFCVSAFIFFGAWSAGAGQSEISLKKSVVVLDVAEASYVHYTVNELRQQIKALTGNAPVLYYDLKEALQRPCGGDCGKCKVWP